MKVVLAALAALVAPSSAAAALEVKLSVVPDPPRKDATTVVQLRPYWTYKRPDGSCCLLRRADVKYPFRIETVTPKGVVNRFAMRRGKNRFVWSLRIVFAARGRWTVRAPQWGPRYSRNFGARPRISFMVS